MKSRQNVKTTREQFVMEHKKVGAQKGLSAKVETLTSLTNRHGSYMIHCPSSLTLSAIIPKLLHGLIMFDISRRLCHV